MAGQEDNKTKEDETSPNKEVEEQAEDGPVAEEYDMLDSQLDDLNQALDVLEQKNDYIHKKLKELLQSNRDIRQELKNENANLDSTANN